MNRHTKNINYLHDRIATSTKQYSFNGQLSLTKEVKLIGNLCELLSKFDDSKSPAHTSDTHLKLVHDQSERLKARIKISERVLGELQSSVFGHIADRINNKLNLNENSYANEIRTVFRGMKKGDKTALLNKMVINQDNTGIAAILNAPEYITSVPRETSERIMTSYRERWAGDLVKEEAVMLEAFESVPNILLSANDCSDSFSNKRDVERIEQADENNKEVKSELQRLHG